MQRETRVSIPLNRVFHVTFLDSLESVKSTCLNPLKSGLSCNFTSNGYFKMTFRLNPLKSGLSCNND